MILFGAVLLVLAHLDLSQGCFKAPTPDPTPAPTPTTNPAPTLTPTVTSTCNCGVANPPRNRIVGGVNAGKHEIPWVVAMRRLTGFQFCGGTLISDQWVLTAAHCVDDGTEPSDVTLSLADHDKNSITETDKTVTRPALQIIVHESWDSPRLNNDIAVIKIAKVTLTRELAPVCLASSQTPVSGRTGTVAGWGLVEEDGVSSSILQKVDLALYTASECRIKYPEFFDVTDKMMCGYAKGKDSCNGDSGGPLFRDEGGRNRIVGIVSFGRGCAREGSPGAYTNVGSYTNWIQEKTGVTPCVN